MQGKGRQDREGEDGNVGGGQTETHTALYKVRLVL